MGYEHNVIFNFALLAPVASPNARDSAPVIALHFPGTGFTFGITFLNSFNIDLGFTVSLS